MVETDLKQRLNKLAKRIGILLSVCPSLHLVLLYL
jgi:hypothetical protein